MPKPGWLIIGLLLFALGYWVRGRQDAAAPAAASDDDDHDSDDADHDDRSADAGARPKSSLEVVAQTHVQREPGYLYFLRGSEVWRTPMKRAGAGVVGQAEMVARGGFVREPGYLYFLDKDGNVARAKRAVTDDEER